MNHYWVVARARNHPDERIKRIEASTDKEACEKAEKWRREDLGFWEIVAIAKEISATEAETNVHSSCKYCRCLKEEILIEIGRGPLRPSRLLRLMSGLGDYQKIQDAMIELVNEGKIEFTSDRHLILRQPATKGA